MSASVALLGWDEEPIRVVQDVDWVLDDRADSTNQLRVTTSLAEADGVKAEQEIIFKGRRFRVSDIDRDRDADTAVIVADEAQAALADIVLTDFRPINRSLSGAMNDILSGTRWTIGEAVGARDGNANFDEITALDALQFLARHQDAQLGFDSLRRRVNITPTKGTEYEYVFTYGRQLSNIQKSEIAPQTTVIYPTMGGGDEEVALDPVEDYGYYFAQGLSLAEARARFRKEDHWAERDYEFAENMTRDAQKRLAEEAYPQITYTLTAQATVSVDGVDDFDLAELHLGDQVYVWDQEIDAKLRAEVSAVTTSSDQSENVLTLSALPASLGASVEGRYFGDSGRPSSGGRRRSGPQPRPSMPILEQMGDYGIAVTRWNGQDHDGNYNTIPQRFGTLLTLVAPLEDGVIPSPMDSSHTFMGSDIVKRGGGTSTIGFNGYGEFAIWHQMRGWDGETMSQLSEPLVVDVPRAWDPRPTVAKVDDLNDVRLPALRVRLDTIEPVIDDYDDRITSARDAADQARNSAENIRDEVLPPLQNNLTDLRENRLPAVEGELNQTRLGMENLRDVTLPDLDQELRAGIQGIDTRVSELAITDDTDLFADPGVYLTGAFRDTLWSSSSNNFQFNPATIPGANATYYLGAAPGNDLRFRSSRSGPSAGNGWVVHEPGTEYRLDYLYRVLGAGGASSTAQVGAVTFEWTEAPGQATPGNYTTGATIRRHEADNSSGGAISLSSLHRGSVVVGNVPDNAGRVRFILSTRASADVPSDALIQFARFQVNRMNAGKLIVDGSISARHIMAESIAGAVGEFLHISADQIDTENLAAYLATIIELDAGQITAGKINTERLDAQEVAGAVANFLTLDALEINVEQIAGEIANIIEITAESIQAGAIQARHLSVVNNENLFGDDDWSDISEDSNTGGWRIDGATPSQVSVRQAASGYRVLEFAGAVGTPTSRVDVTYPGPGWKVRPGDTFHYSFVAWRNNAAALNAPDVRFWFPITDRNGSHVGFAGGHDSIDSEWTTGYTTYEGELEVPDDIGEDLFMRAQIRTQLNASGAQILFARPFMRRKSGGELIVDGGIKARNLDAEEIFFDQAVGNTVAAGVGEFLELDADQIRSNSWTGIVATGATFQTHAQANRGVKMQPGGLRGWDNSGNLRFDLSASTGNMLATGVFRTAVSGSRAELDPHTFGGRLSFYRGNGIGTLKLNDGLERLEMVYGDASNPNQERPNIGVEEERAIVGYRQTQIIVGGTTVENQGITVNGVFRGDVGYRGMIQMEAGARIRYYDNLNRYTATVGQSPGAGSSSMFQIWLERGALNVVNGGIQIPRAYETTSSTDANVYISSSGWLSRATSASRYKLDQQELTVPDSVLDIPMIDWVDKAQTEFKAEMDAKPRPFTENDQKQYDTISLRRVPGVVAETVEAYGGEQFVTYGPDGRVEEVMYPRLALAQIQVLKRRIEALEGAS